MGVGGCGGDDEKKSSGTSTEAPAPTATIETSAPGTTGTSTTETSSTSPEEQPGGAGDEEPIRTEVVLTGNAGKISPSRVQVPPYIGIRVKLRAADGGSYGLRIAGRTLRPGDSVTIAGKRPGKRVTGTPVGGGNKVVIDFSAEPGP